MFFVADFVKRVESKLLKEKTFTFCYNHPKVIQIETTSKCNLSCLWCFRYLREPHNDMSLEVFKRLIEDIGFTKELYVFGGGEPLLHPKFDKIISMASKLSDFVGISSNAMLLNKENTEKLKDSRLSELTVSIDSPDPKEYSLIRKNANLKQIKKNLRYFTFKTQIPLRVHAVLSSINLISCLGLPKLAKELCAEKLTLNILHPTTPKHLNLMPNPKTTSTVLQKIQTSCRELNLVSNAKRMLNKKPETLLCKAPLFSCAVDSEGYFLPCCNYPQLRLGNVRRGFKYCWNSESVRGFRKYILKGTFAHWCNLFCLTPRRLLDKIHRVKE